MTKLETICRKLAKASAYILMSNHTETICWELAKAGAYILIGMSIVILVG